MANTQLFTGTRGKAPRVTDTVNEAGGRAYDPGAKHSLGQYAMTGVFTDKFYTSADEQLKAALDLASKVDSRFIAQLACFARDKGQMKDMPAFLCAVLASRKDPESLRLLKAVFPVVIDNGKMLRNFVQIVRSGVTGRKSFGTAVKKLINGWFAARTPEKIFRDSIGARPSMVDVIKMARPAPRDEEERALRAYMMEHDVEKKKETAQRPRADLSKLPEVVKAFEAWKKDATQPMPDLPFQMLTGTSISDEHWKTIASRANWHTLRMNLNTFKRHGVFDDAAMVKNVAARLRDKETLAKVRVFPYQLLVAYMNAEVDVAIKNALQDALEFVTGNVPVLAGRVVVCPDISGSMHDAVTGARGSATSKVMVLDVASLIASCILRTNPEARVIPFNDRVHEIALNPRDAVMTNARKIAGLPQGGTDCAAPLRAVKGEVDLIVMVSDNESWIQSPTAGGRSGYGRGTDMAHEWARIRGKNPKAKLVCIDIAPTASVQVYDEKNAVLNVGGYGDHMFDQIAAFMRGEGPDTWVKEIEATTI